jgi:hypothetical protein
MHKIIALLVAAACVAVANGQPSKNSVFLEFLQNCCRCQQGATQCMPEHRRTGNMCSMYQDGTARRRSVRTEGHTGEWWHVADARFVRKSLAIMFSRLPLILHLPWCRQRTGVSAGNSRPKLCRKARGVSADWLLNLKNL